MCLTVYIHNLSSLLLWVVLRHTCDIAGSLIFKVFAKPKEIITSHVCERRIAHFLVMRRELQDNESTKKLPARLFNLLRCNMPLFSLLYRILLLWLKTHNQPKCNACVCLHRCMAQEILRGRMYVCPTRGVAASVVGGLGDKFRNLEPNTISRILRIKLFLF